jgi:hypothetical protein
MRFDVDRLKIGPVKASWSFRSVEQNANTTVGPGKANDYSGLTAKFGTAFDT